MYFLTSCPLWGESGGGGRGERLSVSFQKLTEGQKNGGRGTNEKRKENSESLK